MANISYIKLLQAVELFSSEHMQVKRFASDFPAQMPNFGTENEKYPILFVSPNTNIFDENVNIFTIDIYCFDIIQKDRSNINTILSDTNLILSDLHRWLLDGEIFGIDINTQVTTTPIDNALLDYAAGWRMTATFDVDTYAICEIPFANEPVILMEVNDVVYTTTLTCDTLADCDTFTDAIGNLQTQIDNIVGATGPTGPAGPAGATGPQGATGTSLLQNITPDSYLGPRLTPIDGTSNGFYINKSVNGAVGYYVRNTENSGNGSVSEVSVGGTGSLYENYASLFHANNGYFVPYLRGKSGLNSNDDFYFIGWQGASFDFRTGNGSYGTETSKFAISNSGTVSIGVQPLLDNTITDILGRKSDGSIVRVDKSYLDYLQFNTASTAAGAVGRLVWNDTDGTLDLGLKGGNVTLQIGQEQVLRVVNKTATNITLLESNYQAVRVTGAQGQRLKVDLAQATNDLLSAETIGLVTETILNNQEGFITTSGLVRGINTTGSLQGETWLDGDILYLSPTTAGNITKVKPVAPNHLVIIGYVVRAHITQGTIFVKVDNGYELDELHNVKITGATAGQVLSYTGTLWENKSMSQISNIRRHSFSNYNPGTGNSLDYNGYAPYGSSESANVWTITRLTINAFGISTRAYAVNVAWTDRLTVIYT